MFDPRTAPSPPARLSVAANANGLTIQRQAHEARLVPWREITRIAVYKRDVYAHEIVCMAIELNGADTIEIDESIEGWPSLTESLHSHLALTIPHPEWLLRVSFSSFERAPCIIFQRAPADA